MNTSNMGHTTTEEMLRQEHREWQRYQLMLMGYLKVVEAPREPSDKEAYDKMLQGRK